MSRQDSWDQLLQDPTILLRPTHSLGLATSNLQHFDGRVGAVVFEGRHFVTSPNMDHIYSPPQTKRMTFKSDYRLGEHDPLLWPQPLLEPQCHLPCIPRHLEVFEESSRSVYRILFHKVDFTDFFPIEGDPISGLGFISGANIASLKKLGRLLEKQHETMDANIASSTPILNHLLVIVKRTLISLEHLPMTKRQALFLFAEIQRYMLEFSAAYRYLTIYKPRMLNDLPPSTIVEDLVGAFAFNLADADNYMRAGVPVWIIRPAALAGTVRVEKLVELIEPRDQLCLEDAYDTYPVFYDGPPYSIAKYKTFARYSGSFLSYSNPFQYVSSTPSSFRPKAFAATQPAARQVPGAATSGMERYGQSKRSLSSVRHEPYSRNRSNKPPGPAGRNKFEELSSPFLPLPIVAWRDALKKVVVDPEQDASSNKYDRGYVFPDPGLFLGVGSSEAQAKFFYNWLKYRPALIYRLTAHNSNSKPLASQTWRSMLHLPIQGHRPAGSSHASQSTLPAPLSSLPTLPSSSYYRTTPGFPETTPTPERTKTAKRLEVVQALLKNCLNVDGVQFNDMPTNEIFWKEQRLSAGRLPDQHIGQQILWELFELNFRFEFMALDSRAHIPLVPPTHEVPREDLILQCFPGNIGGSILVAQREFAHQGLAASSWIDRAPFIVACKNVMSTWTGFQKVVECCSKVDFNKSTHIETYSETEIDAMELAIATFYTQTFYDFFGRAAIIPRRLASGPREPALDR